jgi:Spy/CpxP family protein refolding chaperone
MKTKLAMCFVALAMSFTSLSYAQPSVPAGSRVEKRFKKKRGQLLRKRLGLDDTKATQVEAILDKHGKQHRQWGRQVHQARRNLAKLLRQDSNDQKAYAQALTQMQAASAELQKLRQRQFVELKKVLRPKEQAKLLRMLNRVHRKLRERRRKRRTQRRRPGLRRGKGRPKRRGPRR